MSLGKVIVNEVQLPEYDAITN